MARVSDDVPHSAVRQASRIPTPSRTRKASPQNIRSKTTLQKASVEVSRSSITRSFRTKEIDNSAPPLLQAPTSVDDRRKRSQIPTFQTQTRGKTYVEPPSLSVEKLRPSSELEITDGSNAKRPKNNASQAPIIGVKQSSTCRVINLGQSYAPATLYDNKAEISKKHTSASNKWDKRLPPCSQESRVSKLRLQLAKADRSASDENLALRSGRYKQYQTPTQIPGKVLKTAAVTISDRPSSCTAIFEPPDEFVLQPTISETQLDQDITNISLQRYGVTVREASDAGDLITGSKKFTTLSNSQRMSTTGKTKDVNILSKDSPVASSFKTKHTQTRQTTSPRKLTSNMSNPENPFVCRSGQLPVIQKAQSSSQVYPPRTSSLPQAPRIEPSPREAAFLRRLTRPTFASNIREDIQIQESGYSLMQSSWVRKAALKSLRQDVGNGLRRLLKYSVIESGSSMPQQLFHTSNATSIGEVGANVARATSQSTQEALKARLERREEGRMVGLSRRIIDEKDLYYLSRSFTATDLDSLALTDRLIESSTLRLRQLLTHARSLPESLRRQRLEPKCQRLSTRLLEVRRVEVDVIESIKLIERLVVDVSRDILDTLEGEGL